MRVVGVQDDLGGKTAVGSIVGATLTRRLRLSQAYSVISPRSPESLGRLRPLGPHVTGCAVAFGIVGVPVCSVEQGFVVGAGDVGRGRAIRAHCDAVAVGIVGVGFVGGQGALSLALSRRERGIIGAGQLVGRVVGVEDGAVGEVASVKRPAES